MIANFQNKNAAYFTRRDVNLKVPAVGKFARLLHDTEHEEYNFQPRQKLGGFGGDYPVPSTRQFYYRRNHPLTRQDHVIIPDEWAWRWLEVFNWAANGLLDVAKQKYLWMKVTENRVAFTDNNSWQNGYREPVNNINPTKPNMALATLGCTGNIVKIIGSYGQYYIIEAFDLSKPPPPLYEIIRQSHKMFWATEITPAGVVAGFPHLENLLGQVTSLPMPIVSVDGIQWVRKVDVEILENGKEYSSYVS